MNNEEKVGLEEDDRPKPAIAILLDMLELDFPELVSAGREVLADKSHSFEESEAILRRMIEAEATWLKSRKARFQPDWIRARAKHWRKAADSERRRNAARNPSTQ